MANLMAKRHRAMLLRGRLLSAQLGVTAAGHAGAVNDSTSRQNADLQANPGAEFVDPYMALSLWTTPGTLNGPQLPAFPVTIEAQAHHSDPFRTMVMHWGFAAQQGAAFERLVRILTDKWSGDLSRAIDALNLDQEDRRIVDEARHARNRLAHATVSYDLWSGTFVIEEPERPPRGDGPVEALQADRYHVENAKEGKGPDTPVAATTTDVAAVDAMAVTIRGAMKAIAQSDGWRRDSR